MHHSGTPGLPRRSRMSGRRLTRNCLLVVIMVQVSDRFPLLAKGVQRVDSDFADDVGWLKKLEAHGFTKELKTVWVRATWREEEDDEMMMMIMMMMIMRGVVSMMRSATLRIWPQGVYGKAKPCTAMLLRGTTAWLP
jgi:hypothetical protein